HRRDPLVEWHDLRQQRADRRAGGHLRSGRWMAGPRRTSRAGLSRSGEQPPASGQAAALRHVASAGPPHGSMKMKRTAVAVIHRWISLPRAPTLATTAAYPHSESVTHVLGLKCHP